ncbi:hypothetical protein ONE63_003437 [Megalurothrips usitatus]|uniref:JmjC domain-containing protein n=1 Tax=Megalurothrips usitatus TaxID=439358 RepID=A0AAV7XBA6_9NEOP|nr:hypothetical protein ONE63_003437 [Megalurothrips usitatus]
MSEVRMPWMKVEIDEIGGETLLVEEKHLTNFPKFMQYVINQKIGMSKGYFKIVIVDEVQKTNIEDLCKFIKSYLSALEAPKSLEEAEDSGAAYPFEQKFFYGSQEDHLYGLQVDVCSKSQFTRFVNKVSEPDTYSVSSECWCVSERSDVLKPIVNKAAKQKLLDDAAQQRIKYGLPELHGGGDQTCLETARKRRKRETILYCPGIPMEEIEFPATENFNLSKLGTILDTYPDVIPGLGYPFLYVGAKHASFAWHVEDACLYSINYLHFGAPCVWFFVSPYDYKKFNDVAKLFPLDPGHVTCSAVLMHKYLVISADLLQKYGISVHTVIQKAGEIIVTYPYAAHSGFKMGYNISQAANFADPCPKYVHLDLSRFVALVCPNLLDMYLRRDYIGLIAAVKGNDFIAALKILPQLDLSSKEISCNTEDANSEVSDQCGDTLEENAVPTQSCKSSFQGARYTLICPEGCGKTFQGGRARLSRMLDHINKCHPNRPDLLNMVFSSNPSKPLKSQSLTCPYCGLKRAGKRLHLNRHIRAMHPGKQEVE